MRHMRRRLHKLWMGIGEWGRAPAGVGISATSFASSEAEPKGYLLVSQALRESRAERGWAGPARA
jgi:hypothetical protein